MSILRIHRNCNDLGRRFVFRRLLSVSIGAAVFFSAPALFAQQDAPDEARKAGGFTRLNKTSPEGFAAGRFLIEGRANFGLGFSGSIYKNFQDQNATLPIGPAALQSGDAGLIAASFLTRQSAPEARLRSFGANLAVEYALLDWLGVGLDLGTTSLSVKSARVISTGTEVSFALISQLTGAQATSATTELLYPFIVQDFGDYDAIHHADATLALHPLGGSGVVDPYLKAIGGYGRTREDGFTSVRYGAALGARYFLSDWVYLVGEVSWINNEISGEVDTSVGFLESSSEFSGSLRETSGQLGVGFAF